MHHPVRQLDCSTRNGSLSHSSARSLMFGGCGGIQSLGGCRRKRRRTAEWRLSLFLSGFCSRTCLLEARGVTSRPKMKSRKRCLSQSARNGTEFLTYCDYVDLVSMCGSATWTIGRGVCACVCFGRGRG